jgi:hypothetical protein
MSQTVTVNMSYSPEERQGRALVVYIISKQEVRQEEGLIYHEDKVEH